MARQKTKGTCLYCQKEVGKGFILRHLASCPEREKINATPTKAKLRPVLHLYIEAEYVPMYYLHVEIPADATLQDLDQFLRDTWLECCGHLSAFKFGTQRYGSYPIEELHEKDLSTPVGGGVY